MQPLLVLHCAHSLAQDWSHITLQQLGSLAQTQVSQTQPLHDLPCTALQPLWVTMGKLQAPLMHCLPPLQEAQYWPPRPQAPILWPERQLLPLMHPLQQVPATHLPPPVQPLPVGRLLTLQAPVMQDAILQELEVVHVPQVAKPLPQ